MFPNVNCQTRYVALEGSPAHKTTKTKTKLPPYS